MSKARNLADLASSSVGKTYEKNLIKNGAMQISQRGYQDGDWSTSDVKPVFGSSLGTRWKLTDGWHIWQDNSNTSVIKKTRSSTTPSGQGYEYSLEFEVTTARTDLSNPIIDGLMTTRIWTGVPASKVIDKLKYGTVDAVASVCSFWVKSSVTGTYQWQARTSTGRRFISSFTVSTADTWEQKTISVPADTATLTSPNDWINNNSEYQCGLAIQWVLGAGGYSAGAITDPADAAVYSSGAWFADTQGRNPSVPGINSAYGHAVAWEDTVGNTFNITGVQWEVGTTATDYEHKPYETELWECRTKLFRRTGQGIHGHSGHGTQYDGYPIASVPYPFADGLKTPEDDHTDFANPHDGQKVLMNPGISISAFNHFELQSNLLDSGREVTSISTTISTSGTGTITGIVDLATGFTENTFMFDVETSALDRATEERDITRLMSISDSAYTEFDAEESLTRSRYSYDMMN